LETKRVILKSDDKATHIPNSKLLEILEIEHEEKWEKIQELIKSLCDHSIEMFYIVQYHTL
jgi:hypothetical protein